MTKTKTMPAQNLFRYMSFKYVTYFSKVKNIPGKQIKDGPGADPQHSTKACPNKYF